MKITCQSCAAKYTIADEKVAGKTVKIKCKKCGATIVVNGAEVGFQPTAPAALDPGYGQPPPPEEDEGDGQTSVAAGDQPVGAPTGGDDWTVNVADDDQRTMTSAQIAEAYAAGTVTTDTYVWKDGMADWSPLSGVPQLMALVSRPAPAAAAPAPRHVAAAAAPPVAAGGFGLAGQGVSEAAPAAARRAAARPEAADPFQQSREAQAAAAPPPKPGERAVGERNENSMLFSISALTAAKEARDNDRKGPAARNGGRGGVDDIMNLGGGIAAAPILAPPPLLAPVVEAPPAAPIAPVMAAPGMMHSPMAPMGATALPADDTFGRKKSPVGLIVGIVAGLAVLGGAAFFFLSSGSDTQATTPEQTTTSTTGAPAAPTGASPSPADAPAAANTGAAPAAAAPGDVGATAPGGAVATQPGRSGTPAPGAPMGGTAPGSGTKPGDKPGAAPAATAEAPAPKPAETAAPAAAAPEGAAEFNRGAASSALASAAGAAKSCKKPDGPTGSGRVKVTFAPSGNVTSAQVEGPPFAGTAVGGCIASAFRGARVPPFSGPPVSVGKSFTIN